MKLLTLALTAALVALTSTGAAAQEFETVAAEKVHTSGPRAGSRTTIEVASTGAVRMRVRSTGGTERQLSGAASSNELTALRRAFRDGRVEELPLQIMLFGEGESPGTLCIESVLPGGQKVTTNAALDLYGDYEDRIEPLLTVLGSIVERLLAESRGGFKQITLAVRATGGPTPGATSAFNLQSTGGARLDRRLPNSPAKPAQGQATPEELKRVAAAVAKADLDSIPNGPIVDPREATSVSELTLVVIRADGTPRTINARRDLYGTHQLADLVDALDAIAKRLATSGPTGDVAGAGRGLTDVLRGR